MGYPAAMNVMVDPARKPNSAQHRVPKGHLVYAIGDVHGCLRPLEYLLRAIEQDCVGHEGEVVLVFLGDYIDRGPNSRGVVERLSSGRLPGTSHHFLAGNHEAVLLDALEGDEGQALGWLEFGGIETLKSYGVKRKAIARAIDDGVVVDLIAEALPKKHRKWLASLEARLRLGDYLFVHAGIRPGVKLKHQELEDLIWIRHPFLQSDEEHGVTVVHGHSISRKPDERHNRIGIDTGCYATGRLTALRLKGKKRKFLTSRP